MTQSQMTRLAIAMGILYGVYKFVPHQAAKGAALGVAGVLVAKQAPIFKEML